MQLDAKTRKAIGKARQALGATEAILFGSRARDEAGQDSDVDLCFLFASFNENPLELMYQLRRNIHEDCDVALDILVYEQVFFEARARQTNSFEYMIRTEGVAV